MKKLNQHNIFHKIVLKVLSAIILLQIIFIFESFGQSTTEDLGRIVFKAFKEDSLALVYKLKPTYAELCYLMDSIGLDRKTLPKPDFEKDYNKSLIEFRKQCEKIYKNAKLYNLKWSKAVLQKVATYEKRGFYMTSNLKGKETVNYIVKIFFYCYDQQYMLVLGDVWLYKDVWKIGSQFDFEVLNKR